MKTRQSPRRGNLGSALSSYSDEQKHVKPEDISSVPTPPLAGGTNHHPGESAMLSGAEEKPPATTEIEAGNGGAATVVSDTAGGGGRSGSIDFRSRSDTFGSLGITLDDFRGRSETLGSAADVLADCLGPFPSVLDVNVHALPPDQRQVYSANQAQALHQQYQAAQQQQQQQQQVPTSGALPVPKQIGGGGGSNPGSQPSSQGSASGFLSHNFGNSTRKVAAAAAAGSGGSSNQKIPAGGIAHTPPSALGPASYEAKHFGKRMRAGSISGRLRSASDLEDRGIIDRAQKGIIKDLIISGDDALQSALDRYEQGDKSELESMIKSGRLQSYQSGDGAHGGSNIDILGDLDLDFLTVGDDLGGSIGHMDMDEAPNSSAAAAAHANHPGAPADGIGDLDFNEDYSGGAEQYELPSSGSHPGQPVSGALGMSQNQGDGRWRANSLAFGGLLNETPPQTPSAYSNWMDDPDAMGNGEITLDANGQLVMAAGGKNLANLTKKQERELKKAAKEREKREKKLKKEQEKKARAEEKARRRSLSPKGSKKKDDKSKSKRSMSPKSGRSGADDDMDAKEPTPSGLGLPRSMSDPNLRVGLDKDGLLCVEAPEGWVGAYSPDSRKIRIERFLAKRQHRVWTKKVKYDVRKNFADSRLRVKGRFLKKEDELLMRDLMSLT